MFEFSTWNRKRKVQGLINDAQLIIDHIYQTTRPEKVIEIARITSQHIEHAQTTFGETVIGLKRAIDEYKRLHNEARRQRDDISLSAFTLVQIYFHSVAVGQECQPAKEIIKAFIRDSK